MGCGDGRGDGRLGGWGREREDGIRIKGLEKG